MKDLLLNLHEQVVLHSLRYAVIQGDQRVTYRELWHQIEAIAERLRNGGLKPNDGVALLMENSAQYIAAYFAVWHIGGYVVALNTSLKVRELANLISHCEAKLVLHDVRAKELSSLSELIGDSSQLQALQVEFKEGAAEDSKNYVAPDKPDMHALASVIYTSGTTGHPKGVMLSRKNLQSNTNSIIKYLSLTSGDKVMCVLPFFYSYGNSVMHTHLAVGATLVLENSFLYPNKVLQVMEQEEVTGFSGVPTTYSLLLARTKLQNYKLPKLRYVTQAGGAMAPKAIEQIQVFWQQTRFFVMYGQTEASARLTYLKPERLKEKLGSAGCAIPDVELKIVDEQGCDVAIGTQGEVCARGDNVMLGYLHDPEETAKTVVGGWLKTGDVGYLDSEGYLFLVGRNKEMIKSGAHRIAPVEIEEIIREHDKVAEVAIVGVADELLGQVIKAFVVLKENKGIEKRDLMRFFKERLPQYKIPKSIEFINDLPKTASGKVKKHQLVN
ncbi:MAG: acyl--CoA ligase [Candidatus Polarisedimenticolaceae bacterium]|nr:acyl--CoA ligase [Candidatus Polarisedimenticolaceae bacterium]